MSERTSPSVQDELDVIERAVHRARDIETGSADVHPMDYQLPSGAELRQLRKACGLTAEEAGARVDLTRESVYNIENGNSRPSVQKLQRFLRLYRMEWPRGEADE